MSKFDDQFKDNFKIFYSFPGIYEYLEYIVSKTEHVGVTVCLLVMNSF